MSSLNATAHRVLDTAERLTQRYGFNALSYKDLQNEVGIKTSSIHYYFPKKEDLALALVERYTEAFSATLYEIAQSTFDGKAQLMKLAQICAKKVEHEQFCLCGMLASEAGQLTEPVTTKIEYFFESLQQWVIQALQALPNQVTSAVLPCQLVNSAECFVGLLEGGMLLARIKNQPQLLVSMVDTFLSQYTATSS